MSRNKDALSLLYSKFHTFGIGPEHPAIVKYINLSNAYDRHMYIGVRPRDLEIEVAGIFLGLT